MKVEIVRSLDAKNVRKEVNEFIKDKKVVDIKFNELVLHEGAFFKGINQEIVTTAFIMYED